MKQDWHVDRFHIALALIAAGWIVIAGQWLNACHVLEVENLRLREACGVRP